MIAQDSSISPLQDGVSPIIDPMRNMYLQNKGLNNFSNIYASDFLGHKVISEQNVFNSQNISDLNTNYMKMKLNPQELAHYQNLYNSLDTLSVGYIDGGVAAEFLKKSGLPTETLHEIWDLSDVGNLGNLTLESFFAACRLVAHAQNGLPISSEAIVLEPQCLPCFDNLGNSDASVKFNSFCCDELSSAYMPNMSQSTVHETASNPWNCFFSQSAWWEATSYVLTEEARRKYEQIFQMVDTNLDGFIEGAEAKIVLSKSMLPESDMIKIWTLSDQDNDGRLSMQEFVVAMHLIACCKKGFPILNLTPRELQTIINNVTQQTCFPSLNNSSSAFSSIQEKNNKQRELHREFEESSDIFAHFDKKKLKEGMKSKSKEKKQANEDDKEEESVSDAFGSKEFVKLKDKRNKRNKQKKAHNLVNSFEVKESLEDEDDKSETDFLLNRFDFDELKKKTRSDSKCKNRKTKNCFPWNESPSALIANVVNADEQVSKCLGSQYDSRLDDIKWLNQVSNVLKAEIIREKNELENQLDRKRDFEKQLRNVRSGLDELKEEKRKVDLVRVSLHRDIDHYQEEIIFLRQQAEDMKKDIQILHESNKMLFDHTHNTASENIITYNSLDVAHKNVINTIKEEKSLLQKEEQDIDELKHTISRMKREKEDAQAKHAVLQERLRQADQYRSLLMTSLENERLKLFDFLDCHIKFLEEKQILSEELTNFVQLQWIHSQPFLSSLASQNINFEIPNFSNIIKQGAFAKEQKADYEKREKISSLATPRDEKGIPSYSHINNTLPYPKYLVQAQPMNQLNSNSLISKNPLLLLESRGKSEINDKYASKEARGIDKILHIEDSSSPKLNKDGGFASNEQGSKKLLCMLRSRLDNIDVDDGDIIGHKCDIRDLFATHKHTSGLSDFSSIKRTDNNEVLPPADEKHDDGQARVEKDKNCGKMTNKLSGTDYIASCQNNLNDIEVCFSDNFDEEFKTLSLENGKEKKNKSKIKGFIKNKYRT